MVKYLSSIHLTVILFITIILFCILGTVIIQSSTLPYSDVIKASQFYENNYGSFFGKLILKLDFDNLFYSKIFTILLGIFAINIGACTIKNYRLRLLKLGFLLTHISIIIILIGTIVGNIFGDKGFVWIKENSSINYYKSRKTGEFVKLPFQVFLNKFELQYDNNKLYNIDAKVSEDWMNIKNSNLNFRFGAVLNQYISHITVKSEKKPAFKYDLKVNSPLTVGAYNLYQSSYDEKTLKFTGLEVVKDPGLYITYLGFFLLVIGIAFIFYVKPFLIKKAN